MLCISVKGGDKKYTTDRDREREEKREREGEREWAKIVNVTQSHFEENTTKQPAKQKQAAVHFVFNHIPFQKLGTLTHIFTKYVHKD